jgi:hypothetical protein
MIGARHFSGVIDVRAKRGANIELDHTLVVITLRAKICRVNTTRQDQQRRRYVVEKLKSKDKATENYNELESEFKSAHDVQIKHAALINLGMELKKK